MSDPTAEAKSYFAPRAEAYRKSASHGNRVDLDRMIAWTRPRPGERALDVATGGGHTALAFAGAGARVVATDVTREMLAPLALDRALADAHRLPFQSASFDVAASRIAPHHFASLPAFLAECARVLRPGGRFYAFDLTTPEDAEAGSVIDRIERLRDPSHHRSYPLSAWREALARAGLAIDRLDLAASEFDFEAWVARAGMPPERERELRALLRERPAPTLGGYGLTPEGRMRVLRVEALAHRPPTGDPKTVI